MASVLLATLQCAEEDLLLHSNSNMIAAECKNGLTDSELVSANMHAFFFFSWAFCLSNL